MRHDRVLRRFWILDARIHHGMVGALLVLGGLALIIDDWGDRWWIKD